MNIKDPRIGKYFVFGIRGLHVPVKVIKYIQTGYLCRYYPSVRSLVKGLYNKCKCECKQKCLKRCLICIEAKHLIKELSKESGKLLVGE